jgi:peptidoglycan/LPS O-acetylase OafA/YrhL
MHTLERLRHSKGLEGIRGLAVLVVVIYHADLPLRGGHVGVNIFFVLSGFLMTHILLQERIATGTIRFGNFYISRALRLYPALVALVAVVTVYSLVVPDAVRSGASLSGWFPALFYFANWVRAFGHPGALGMYEHTWSLSIEEQFYFLWPLLLWVIFRFVGKLSAVVYVSLAGCVGALLLRLVIAPGVEGEPRVFNGLDTQADQLLFGCALAAGVMWASSSRRTPALERGLTVALWPSVVGLAAAILFWHRIDSTTVVRVATSLVGLAAACVVGYVYLAPHAWVARTLRIAPLKYLGQRSYGLYLWHYPVFTWVFTLSIPKFGMVLLGLALSLGATELSYRYVEKPFREIKSRRTQRQSATMPSSRML